MASAGQPSGVFSRAKDTYARHRRRRWGSDALTERAVIPLKDFNRALTELRSRLPLPLVRDVACRIAAAPESAPRVEGRETRVLHTRSYGEYPAFSLFYYFDERAVYLVHVELRDELEAYGDVESWSESLA